MLPRIAREETKLLQFAAQLGIEFDQRARNAHASRSGLPAHAAAGREYHYVKTVRGFRREQRLAHISPRLFADEIILKRPVVYRNHTFSRPQKHPRGGRLAASRG